MQYYYDEDNHGYAKGHLTQVAYLGGQESYNYDNRGRKIAATQTIGALSKSESMTYNSMDQIASLTYPGGEVVNYGFDQGGQVVSLTGSNSYVSAIAYTPLIKMSQINYGNGVQTNYDYYDTASKADSTAGTYYSYLLKSIQVKSSSASILNLAYQYDKVGNVAVKQDLNNTNLSESYGYDEMNRLTSSKAAVYGNKTFSYDQLDNILQKDGYTYHYDSAKPYTLTNDGRYSYTYDENGSMTGRSDGRTINWDYDNRAIIISDGGSYVYNAQGQRIKKVNNDGTVKYYFFPEYEEEYSAGVLSKSVKYYFANKQRMAENSSTSGVRYYSKDHLGSSSAITDAVGNMVLRTVNSPYGSEVYNQGSGDVAYKFTDKEKDNSGLNYFGARFYDPEMGRFISVDPIKAAINWYAYCNDNPVKYIDPDGKDAIYVDDSSRANGFGHSFLIIINQDGSGTLYSFAPKNDKNVFNAPGMISKVQYSATEMKNGDSLKKALVDKGEQKSPGVPGGADNIDGVKDITCLIIHLDDVSTEKIRDFCDDSLKTIPKYDLRSYNCADYTADAFQTGGIDISRAGVFGDNFTIPDWQCAQVSQDNDDYDGNQ